MRRQGLLPKSERLRVNLGLRNAGEQRKLEILAVHGLRLVQSVWERKARTSHSQAALSYLLSITGSNTCLQRY